MLGSDVIVVTKLSYRDEYILKELRDLGINVIVRESNYTTSFHISYGKTLDDRTLKVYSLADSFTLDDLNCCVNSKYIYLGPLTTNDFNIDLLREASKKSPVILDVQGFNRKVIGDEINYVDWDWKYEGLKYVTILKTDNKEAKLLTGLDDPKEAIDILSSWGPKEVVITSQEGVYILIKGVGKFFAPFIVDRVLGRVGRGDTCIAAYTHARLRNWPIEFTVKFTAAATSLKLAYQGPLRNSEEDVIRYVEKYYGYVDIRI